MDPTGGRRIRCGRTCTPFQSEPDAAPVRLRPACEAHARFPAGPLLTASSPTGTGRCSNWRPTIAATPRSRMPSRPQDEPSPLGPLRRQRRLAGGTGDGPQPRPLDSAHRSGRAGGDHQDPPAAVLLPGRSLGTPPHTASATALALGSPVRSCPGPIARPPVRHSLASQPNVPANSRQPSPRAPLAVSYPAISLSTATVGRHRCPQKRLQTARQPPVYPRARIIEPVTPSPPSAVLTPGPSLSIGGGLR